MLLSALLPDQTVRGDAEIRSLSLDHRQVQPGTLFFCVPGFTRDGHDFATEAVEAGAAALVVERPLGLGVPEVVVDDVRRVMGPVASRFEGEPSRSLDVIGVTGTNGKTTTAFLVRQLLEASGRPCGLLGTVATIVGGERMPAVRTTQEAVDLQRTLRRMADVGDEAAAIEVSSHALELGRVDGTRFAVAIFTNLTQDHLDFHGTMDAYWAAKRRLFTDLAPEASVVNIDDPRGAELAAVAPGVVTCSLAGEADWTASDVVTGLAGSSFTLRGGNETASVSTPLSGDFNIRNILGAAAAVAAIGVPFEEIAGAIGEAGQVPGRFEAIDAGQSFAVIVDYAHTPDSLENVLDAAGRISDGRVIAVFGCGGDRDRGKRPLMGEIAARLTDLAVLTSDNPRSEDPLAILGEIAAGAGTDAKIEPDRAEAIAFAIGQAREGDVVIIAGKGHEQGQELADGKVVPFDDVAVARGVLEELIGGAR